MHNYCIVVLACFFLQTILFDNSEVWIHNKFVTNTYNVNIMLNITSTTFYKGCKMLITYYNYLLYVYLNYLSINNVWHVYIGDDAIANSQLKRVCMQLFSVQYTVHDREFRGNSSNAIRKMNIIVLITGINDGFHYYASTGTSAS